MIKNKWLRYCLYGVLLLAYVIIGYKILTYLYAQKSSTYEILPYMIGSTIIFLLGGMFLGIEQIILEAKKEGNWTINWPKVLFLGLPLLYLAFGIFIGYQPIAFVSESLNIVPVFQVVFGYVVMTSFAKVRK